MDSYKTTFEAWDKAANAYQDKFMHLDLYNETYDVFCELVAKQNARVFEIGCGPGNITKYILAKRPDYSIEAIDVAPSMIVLAKQNNPSVNFKVMDCRDIGTIAATFDAIICGFCLPYLSKEDVAKLIKDCAFLLNRGGVIYLSAIEGDYQKSGYEKSSDGKLEMFLYFHQEDYITETLVNNAFEVVNLQRIPYPKSNGVIDNHLVFIAKRGEPYSKNDP